MIPYVPTAEAEAACVQIRRTLAAHLSAARRELVPAGGRRLGAQRQDRAAEQRDATLVRIMSITEAFCGDRLLSEVEEEVKPGNAGPRSQMWTTAATAAVSSWSSQEKHYKDWLRISTIDWKFVNDLAIARNAIAHGLGYLTRQQLIKRQSNVDKLRGIGIPIVKDRIQVSEASLRFLARRCVAHIESVDEKVSSRVRHTP